MTPIDPVAAWFVTSVLAVLGGTMACVASARDYQDDKAIAAMAVAIVGIIGLLATFPLLVLI